MIKSTTINKQLSNGTTKFSFILYGINCKCAIAKPPNNKIKGFRFKTEKKINVKINPLIIYPMNSSRVLFNSSRFP